MNSICRTSIFLLVYFIKSTSQKCAGGFDVYFILDKSKSVTQENFKTQIVQFVSNMIDNLDSTKTRISLVTFSTYSRIELPLTGDRRKIQEGLDKLKRITPEGDTYIIEGINEVIEQIQQQGRSTASIVIMLTDGQLTGRRSFGRADYLRNQLGATVFAIGVASYKMEELQKLASKPSKDHVYTATNFDTLDKIGDKIVDTACIEVTDVEPGSVCVGIPYDVILYGKGFTKTNGQSNISCNFKYNNTINHVAKPTEIRDDRLKCRAPVLETLDSFVSLQVSFTQNKFVSSDIRVIATSCAFPTQAVLVTLFILILLGLIALWWFYWLLPCVAPKQSTPVPIVVEPVVAEEPVAGEKNKKWPTVDASYYGGGGIGGIKPVKVKWGEKGATDEGNKLMHTPDANVINKGQNEEADIHNEVGPNTASSSSFSPALTLSERILAVLLPLKTFVFYLGGLLLILYGRVAALRPQKGGDSKLYSNSSERKTLCS